MYIHIRAIMQIYMPTLKIQIHMHMHAQLNRHAHAYTPLHTPLYAKLIISKRLGKFR